jgi:hypothetical protein
MAIDFPMIVMVNGKNRLIGSHVATDHRFQSTKLFRRRMRHSYAPAPKVRPSKRPSKRGADIDVSREDPTSTYADDFMGAEFPGADCPPLDCPPVDCPAGLKIKRKPPAKRYLNSVSEFIFWDTPDLTHSNQDAPLLTWRDQYREEYLRQCLTLEGRGRLWSGCTVCQLEPGLFRCRDCTACTVLCRGCALQSHAANPLHILEVSLNSAACPLAHQIAEMEGQPFPTRLPQRSRITFSTGARLWQTLSRSSEGSYRLCSHRA